MKTKLLAVVLCTLCAFASRAQTATGAAGSGSDADALFQAQKWDEAAHAYEQATKADPSNARAWYRLGVSLFSEGKYAEAAAAFDRAREAGKGKPVAPLAMYNLAASYARLGEKQKALDWLDESLKAGLPQPLQLKTDADFESLRAEPRFGEIVKAAERIAMPCMNIEGYRQFDFWVGEWDVYVKNQKVGASNVRLLQQGCIVEENWDGGAGGTGQSFNFYNPVTKKWHQSYMGSGGGNWMMDGEYKDGALRYEGHIYSPPQGDVLVHMTFFNLEPGKVRQTAETSADGGKTWTNVWDSIYVKRK